MSYNNTNSLQTLIKKELDRRQFLVYLGFIILGLSGIPTLLKMFTQSLPENNDKKSIPSFGKGNYGG